MVSTNASIYYDRRIWYDPDYIKMLSYDHRYEKRIIRNVIYKNGQYGLEKCPLHTHPDKLKNYEHVYRIYTNKSISRIQILKIMETIDNRIYNTYLEMNKLINTFDKKKYDLNYFFKEFYNNDWYVYSHTGLIYEYLIPIVKKFCKNPDENVTIPMITDKLLYLKTLLESHIKTVDFNEDDQIRLQMFNNLGYNHNIKYMNKICNIMPELTKSQLTILKIRDDLNIKPNNVQTNCFSEEINELYDAIVIHYKNTQEFIILKIKKIISDNFKRELEIVDKILQIIYL